MSYLILVIAILLLIGEDLFTYHRLAKAKEQAVAAELKHNRTASRLKEAQAKLEQAKRQFGFTMNLLRDQQGIARNALDIRDGVETMAKQLSDLVIYIASPFEAAVPGGRHAMTRGEDPYALEEAPQLQDRYVS